MGEGDEHALDNSVAQRRDDEVVCRSAELDVEETPLVEGLGIRKENVSRVAMHGHGATRNSDNLEGSPSQSQGHTEKEEHSENDLGRGVSLGKLPETENRHLGETNQRHTEENSLQDSEPAVAELEELLALHPLLSDSQLAESLKGGDTKNGEDNENTEEGQASHEEVSRLDLGAEGNSLDSEDDVTAGGKLNVGSLGDDGGNGRNATLGHSGGREGPVHRTLLNLDGGGRQGIEESGRSSTSCPLVPCEYILHELDADDTHRPNEVLSP